ncbi:MAG: response regulator, partial [Planctomycetes bacterium]|nr:response regulator [Planctomycetota bacterium]
SHRRPCIVLVEDDDVDVMVFERGLHKRNLEAPVERAHDGAEALALLRELATRQPPTPALVLLDINMPKMDGHEFLDELRQDPLLAATIVIVLTTSDDPTDVSRTYEKNVAGYVVKDNDAGKLDHLFRLIDGYLGAVSFPKP